MDDLEHASVWRGGVTATYYTKETERVAATANQPDANCPNGGLYLRHYLASKGGGTTGVSIYIDANSFDQLAKMMLEANRKKAIKAFARALIKAEG